MPIHMMREIDKLKRLFVALSTSVEENLRDAVRSVVNRDRDLALRVMERDHDIDRTEVAVEEECLKTLALYQPVAQDLRYIIAILKINHDLERVGDLAVNIAERAIIMAENGVLPSDHGIGAMAEKVQRMIARSLDALLNYDVRLAKEIWLSDDTIDAENRRVCSELEEVIRADPTHIRSMLALISVSRTLERIADHSTNIAKDVIYMIEGEIVRHRSSFYREQIAAGRMPEKGA